MMVCEGSTVKVGGKNYLNISCRGCANNSSLGNNECFEKVREKLNENEDVDGLLFTRSYKKILKEDSFDKLKGFIDVIKNLPEQEGLCESCQEEYILLKMKLKKDPIEGVRYLGKMDKCSEDEEFFEDIEEKLSETKVYEEVKEHGEKFSNREVNHMIFKDNILPSFVSFFLKPLPEDGEVIDKYETDSGKVTIYRPENEPYPVYHVKPKELELSKEKMEILDEGFSKLSEKDFDLDKESDVCKDIIKNIDPSLPEEEIDNLAGILNRYSIGYGIIEVLLGDPNLQDVFVDSPGNRPVHVYHSEIEECSTNVILTEEEIKKLSTRFRMISGRPFDESFPVLHMEINDLNVRVCGVREPLTFKGTGFAFRKHKVKPWTLQQFIKKGMLNGKAAGLLNFLVDGQKSMLITGPRSSGKTSLLGSLMMEIPKKYRTIIIEDTPELPVENLKGEGFNIQHLKIKSTSQGEKYELSAKEALRSALRLGESVLVLGEVRGEEAKALFEAMRVGAAGNIIMGTIHGSAPYDVWDRIVNDLNVPSTSFKAADIIVECAPIRKKEGLKRHRRVVGITEIKKHWTEDPSEEDGFRKLMEYNREKDKLEMTDNIEDSKAIKEIAKKKGMSMEEVKKSIKTRGRIKDLIVEEGGENPELLDMPFAVESVNKLIELARNEENLNYEEIYNRFENWLQKNK